MRSKALPSFWSLFWALPPDVRKQARAAYQRFKHDPYHPSLYFKRIGKAEPPRYSIRIGLNYRALGVRNPDDLVVWYWIGSHAYYDKLLE